MAQADIYYLIIAMEVFEARMQAAFSTMVLVSLEPAEATALLAREGLPVEIAYDNFKFLGGISVEDKLMNRVDEIADEELKSMIRSIHMPYDGIEVDLIPFETVIKRMLKWLDFAHRLETGIAVFHTLKSSSSGFKINLEFFRRIAKEAADVGIRVAVENRPEISLFGSSPKDLRLLVETVGENIGICADIGHANITRNLERLLGILGNFIVEMHLHDNNGERDEHKPPLTGSINWRLVSNWLRTRVEEVNPVFEILCSEQAVICLEIVRKSCSTFNDMILGE